VGCAGLEPDTDRPDRAGQALTAVAHDWRRRGIATLLKRRSRAFPAANGISEVHAWTQQRNVRRRALNERLGYVTRPGSVTARALLPLGWPVD
jgi:mycothiol synthase